MSLRLHDTATGSVRAFVPLRPGRVGIYLCGATVQAPPHIGHLRSAIAFDVLGRWLRLGHGYDVTFVRNVTDIDDKTLARSAEHDVDWWAWAYTHEQLFTAAYDALGVQRPTYEPRATGHVTEMVELMEALVERGHAYPAQDGGGDVYFDVRSLPGYGSLTHQTPDDMAPADDTGERGARGKRDPRDFALWKGAKAGEPESASWPTPFGRGRPGWHLECSAMIRRYLGTEFDVHAGGIDLRFPHHENELAQSRAAGWGFARYWLHNAWVTVGGEKMSKSLGNSLLVDELLARHRPLAMRYYLASVHYRSTIEYHEGSLTEADAAVRRIETFLARAERTLGPVEPAPAPPQAFADAMDDDLNVSAALAVVHALVRDGNTAADGDDPGTLLAAYGQVRAALDVLGLDPSSPAWATEAAQGSGAARAALDVLVAAELERRASARAQRDFATADAVRDRLVAAGIEVADTPEGATWTLAHVDERD